MSSVGDWLGFSRVACTVVLLGGLGALAGCGSKSAGAPDASVPDAPSACELTERTLPIPFDYVLADDHLSVATEGGPIELMIGPWGAHVQPHTGHPEGNVKADWYALWTPDRDSAGLVELTWDTGEVVEAGCDPGARCGVSKSDIEARVPWYEFPDDEVTIVRVQLLARHSSDPYDGEAWDVEVELCPYRYTLGHVGAISDALAEAMLAAGAPDPRVDAPVGPNLIEGLTIAMPAGAPLARPQIRAGVVAENPLYRSGVDSVPEVPWAQVEWSAIHMAESADGIARPEYGYMGEPVVSALRGILDAQANDASNFRYGSVAPWLWRAEHVLVATPPFHRTASSGLVSGIGGWYQRPESGACTPAPFATPACAETFAVFPVHPEGTYFDPADYFSADVKYLVYRGRGAGDATNFIAFGEVLAPLDPDPTSGVLRVVWRHAFDKQYQAISYRFDPVSARMRFRYGALLEAGEVSDPTAFPADAIPPIPSLADPCTAATLICMTQEGYGRPMGYAP